MLRIAQRNAWLSLVFQVGLHTPLYWAYMFHYVTDVRGLTATEFGQLKAIYYFSVLALELPLGVVADRLGRRGVLALGAVFNAIACAFYWRASDFAGFAAAELSVAVSMALCSGSVSALLYDSFAAEGREGDYARFEGRRIATSSVSATLGLFLADLFLVRNGDPVLTFPVTLGISLLGLGAALGMAEPPRTRADSARRIAGDAVRDLVRAPVLVWTIAYAGLAFVGMRAANALVFNPVLSAAHLPVNRWGSIAACIALLGAPASWGAHRLLARLGERTTLALMPASVALLYVLAALWIHPVTALALGLHGFAQGVLPVVVSVLLNRQIVSSERRATVLSFASMAERGLYGVAALLLGWALDVVALRVVLLALAAVSGLSVVAGLLAARAAGRSPAAAV